MEKQSTVFWKDILSKNKSTIFVLVTLVIFQLILSLLPATIFIWLIDKVLVSNNGSLLLLSVVIVVITYGLMELFKAKFDSIYFEKIASAFTLLRFSLFQKIMRGSFKQIKQTKSPLLNILVNDVNFISNSGAQVIPQLFLSSIIAIGAAIYLITINSWFLLSVITISILSLYPIKKINERQKVLVGEAQQKEIEQIDYIKEFFDKPLFIKANYKIDLFAQGIHKIAEKLLSSNLKRELNFRIFLIIRTVADSLIPTIIYGIGGFLYFRNQITIGEITACITLASLINEPITKMTHYFLVIKDLLPRLSRINNTLDEFKEEDSSLSGKLSHVDQVVIEMKNVSYEIDGVQILNKLNIIIDGNTLVKGHSGSGKSTIFNLLMKLAEPTSGEIYINNVPYSTLTRKDLLKFISFVPQQSVFFQGSIKENLKIINPFATDDEVNQVLKICCLDELIKSLPNGVDTELRENASNLSGGQRQRLAIARGLLGNTKIMLLDESFSALDPYIAKTVYQRLISANIAVIQISHREDVNLGTTNTIDMNQLVS
jgi:ABC-type bacteriocin/lantibiotic exporter with double-glycine peptidase domain